MVFDIGLKMSSLTTRLVAESTSFTVRWPRWLPIEEELALNHDIGFTTSFILSYFMLLKALTCGAGGQVAANRRRVYNQP